MSKEQDELKIWYDLSLAPIEIFLWWCPICGSMFQHNLGTRHIRQKGKGGECVGNLIKIQYFR